MGADNIFSNDQEAFDQLYLRGVIDTRLGRQPSLTADPLKQHPLPAYAYYGFDESDVRA